LFGRLIFPVFKVVVSTVRNWNSISNDVRRGSVWVRSGGKVNSRIVSSCDNLAMEWKRR
jgi:hypothetical protein